MASPVRTCRSPAVHLPSLSIRPNCERCACQSRAMAGHRTDSALRPVSDRATAPTTGLPAALDQAVLGRVDRISRYARPHRGQQGQPSGTGYTRVGTGNGARAVTKAITRRRKEEQALSLPKPPLALIRWLLADLGLGADESSRRTLAKLHAKSRDAEVPKHVAPYHGMILLSFRRVAFRSAQGDTCISADPRAVGEGPHR
jgi:hypothetical protein